jgi:pimeloyl-ACP methyl ester carboxylesterase
MTVERQLSDDPRVDEVSVDELSVDDRGDGPVVVLLHAFPCSGAMWAPQADALRTAGRRVVVPDLPGFGGSPLLPGEPSLDDVADAVLADLHARGVRSFDLGGVSLGGYVAMAILRRRSEEVTSLVLCDTKATADGAAARDSRERLAQLCLASPSDTGRVLQQAVLPGLLGDTTRASRPAVVALVTGWLNEVAADTVAWYQRAMAIRPDSLDVLSGFERPATVVWGDEDALSSLSEQEVMLDALPDAQIALIERAGHLANVERPEAVSGVLVDVLGSA